MERFYSLLLWLYPRDVRRRFAGEMRRTFHDLLDQERARSFAAAWSLCLRETVQIIADAVSERVRRASSGRFSSFVESLAQDVRLAGRGLKNRPGLAAVVVLTLALAVGANASVFGVVQAVLLQPLPFPDSERLVMVWENRTARQGKGKEWMEWPVLQELKKRPDVLAAAGVFEIRPGAVRTSRQATPSAQAEGPPLRIAAGENPSQSAFAGQSATNQSPASGAPRPVVVAEVSSGFLKALSLDPLLGRLLRDPQDDRPRAPGVVLLSRGFWQSAFSSDAGVLGRKIVLDDEEATVIGVLPEVPIPELQAADLWLNLRADERSHPMGHFTLRAVGRLQPEITAREAESRLNMAVTRAAQADNRFEDIGVGVVSLTQEIQPSAVRQGLMLMLLAAGCLLLAGCANIAGLLLGRVLKRRPEMALRSALGGQRPRLLRQVLTENLLLALLGGAAGWMVAGLSGWLLIEMAPPGLHLSSASGASLAGPRFEPSLVLFALGLSLLAGLLFGLLPAFHLSRWPASALATPKGPLSYPGHSRLRAFLAAGQVALALLLLLASGLLLRSFNRLLRVDLGFDPQDRIAFHLETPDAAQARRLLEQLPDVLRSDPRIRQAALVSPLPLGGVDTDIDLKSLNQVTDEPFNGDRVRTDEEIAVRSGPVWYRRVSGGYFEAMGIPLLAGRGLDQDDVRFKRLVAVVSQETAEVFWPGRSPLGRRLSDGDAVVEVVGLVGGVRHEGLRQNPRPEIYLPATIIPHPAVDLVVQSSAPIEDLRQLVTGHVGDLAPASAVSPPASLQALAEDALQLPRFLTVLTSAFAVLAVLCALLGIASSLTSQVQGRRGELGLRLALGARRRHLFTAVLARGLSLTAAGLLLGWGLSALLSELLAVRLANVLFRTDPSDGITFGLVSLVLIAVSLAASLIPAWQASRTDPLLTLRE